MNVFLAASLSQLIGAFHVLQVICFQTMMNLKYPGNAQFYASQIISLLNVDVLEPEEINAFFGFDFSGDYWLMKQTYTYFQQYDIIA